MSHAFAMLMSPVSLSVCVCLCETVSVRAYPEPHCDAVTQTFEGEGAYCFVFKIIHNLCSTKRKPTRCRVLMSKGHADEERIEMEGKL